MFVTNKSRPEWPCNVALYSSLWHKISSTSEVKFLAKHLLSKPTLVGVPTGFSSPQIYLQTPILAKLAIYISSRMVPVYFGRSRGKAGSVLHGERSAQRTKEFSIPITPAWSSEVGLSIRTQNGANTIQKQGIWQKMTWIGPLPHFLRPMREVPILSGL